MERTTIKTAKKAMTTNEITTLLEKANPILEKAGENLGEMIGRLIDKMFPHA